MASLSFGLTHLNTVERRKIKSGSSAASAGGPGHSIDASASNIRSPRLVSHRLRNLRVMDFSVGKANYLSAAKRAGRPAAGAAGRRLTWCEAFLLRLGPKSLEPEARRW